MSDLAAYPLAYPFASLNESASYLQSSSFSRQSGDDVVALVCSSTRASHSGAPTPAERHCRSLSVRELAVLGSVERFKYLSATQIERLHFAGHATALTGARMCRRVLERLTAGKLLYRLARRIGGVYAGSASYVYALAPRGYSLLHGAHRKRLRRWEPSEELLQHTLVIAELAIDLACQARAGLLQLDKLELEPHCWRRFTAGLEGPQVLKPDLEVQLGSGSYEYHWFVELDRATQSSSAVLRKCRLYQRYWQCGQEQERGDLFPKVLFVAPSPRRAAVIERTLAGARRVNKGLFAVTTTELAVARLTGETS